MQPGDHPYTPLFCEENIWHLAGALLAQGADPGEVWVLLLSNPARQMVMFQQRRAGAEGYVVWDYHVVLQAGGLIYDFDTALPFPVAVRDYFAGSFGEQETILRRFRGMVRRIPALSFRHRFFSDRSHMHGQLPEEQFPPWPAIMPDIPQAIPLRDYWDMSKLLDDGSELFTAAAYLQSLPRA